MLAAAPGECIRRGRGRPLPEPPSTMQASSRIRAAAAVAFLDTRERPRYFERDSGAPARAPATLAATIDPPQTKPR